MQDRFLLDCASSFLKARRADCTMAVIKRTEKGHARGGQLPCLRLCSPALLVAARAFLCIRGCHSAQHARAHHLWASGGLISQPHPHCTEGELGIVRHQRTRSSSTRRMVRFTWVWLTLNNEVVNACDGVFWITARYINAHSLQSQ